MVIIIRERERERKGGYISREKVKIVMLILATC
jgi:hypothetical protein